MVICDQGEYHIVSLEESRLHINSIKQFFLVQVRQVCGFISHVKRNLVFDRTVRELENYFE